MAPTPFSENGPVARNFPADAHGCIMVWVNIRPRIQECRRDVQRPLASSPRFIVELSLEAPQEIHLPRGYGRD
jgi:hypothetical protein